MVIQCPHCCTELELPDESVGWKVQCIYCNKKFIATEEFVKQQKEALKRKTIRIGSVLRTEKQHVTTPAQKRGVTVVDGGEIPDGSPFWMYVPSWIIILTFPLWIVPYLIYAMLRPLDPNYESMHDKMVRLGIEKDDDDAWSYEARERWQWTLGTGRYAEKD